MQVTCQSCGILFEAKRKSRQFCSDTCRQRLRRGNVIAMPTKATPAQNKPTTTRATVYEATAGELDKLGFADTTLGSMALALAQRIDVGNETGAATASLARELRATMEAIEAKVPAPVGKVSDLRLRLLERVEPSA